MATENTDSKKAKKTERYFFNAAGEQFKRPTGGIVGFSLKDIASGQEIKRRFDEYPGAVRLCAEAFGFMTSLGNTVGKANSDFEDALARDEVFMNGEWAEAGEAGPRISILAQAIVRAAASKGKELQIDAISEKLKAMDDSARKSLKDDAEIAAAFAEIQLEAAKERAKQAKANAKASTKPSALDSF